MALRDTAWIDKGPETRMDIRGIRDGRGQPRDGVVGEDISGGYWPPGWRVWLFFMHGKVTLFQRW